MRSGIVLGHTPFPHPCPPPFATQISSCDRPSFSLFLPFVIVLSVPFPIV